MMYLVPLALAAVVGFFYRSDVIHFLYTRVLKNVLFLMDPEVTHEIFMAIGQVLARVAPARSFTRIMFAYEDPILEQTIQGVTHPNPVGLGGGFDKNGILTRILPSVGFGLLECGSITGNPCKGNPGKRLWRLPKEKSIRVWYGLKNEGCDIISERLKDAHDPNERTVIAANIAMTNCKETGESAATDTPTTAVEDYFRAFVKMEPVVESITINISCPNAVGGQPFCDPKKLETLLSKLSEHKTTKPVSLKLSPDLSLQRIKEIVDVTDRFPFITGFVGTNLTKEKEMCEKYGSPGGFSGGLCAEKSFLLLKRLYSVTKAVGKSYHITSLGGIMNAEDAYQRILHGADLVQVVSAMIFEGPQVVGAINKGIAQRLRRDGYANIKDAVGAAYSHGKVKV